MMLLEVPQGVIAIEGASRTARLTLESTALPLRNMWVRHLLRVGAIASAEYLGEHSEGEGGTVPADGPHGGGSLSESSCILCYFDTPDGMYRARVLCTIEEGVEISQAVSMLPAHLRLSVLRWLVARGEFGALTLLNQ